MDVFRTSVAVIFPPPDRPRKSSWAYAGRQTEAREQAMSELDTSGKPRVRTKVFGCIGCLPFSFGVFVALAYGVTWLIP